LQIHTSGAQRASSDRPIRLLALSVLAAVVAFGGLAFNPTPASAASVKVVVIVGPVGSSTAGYIKSAKHYASVARGYGATVKELYSPNATWSKVKAAAVGANIVIYLGHGNGHPSPYGAFYADRKDGFGLNKTAGAGNSNNKYYGETYVKTLDLQKNAVVILNRLCYASGNSEWGMANPTKTTAKKRADNYGAGFLRAGARAVFANGIDSISSIIKYLLTSKHTIGWIFASDPAWTGTRDFKFASNRTNGFTVWMDPYKAGRYYHSVVGRLSLTATAVRAGG
jgi:hypothetical protein